MKMEPIVSSETSAIRTQAPGNYPKRNKLHLEHGESLKTKKVTSLFGGAWKGRKRRPAKQGREKKDKKEKLKNQ